MAHVWFSKEALKCYLLVFYRFTYRKYLSSLIQWWDIFLSNKTQGSIVGSLCPFTLHMMCKSWGTPFMQWIFIKFFMGVIMQKGKLLEGSPFHMWLRSEMGVMWTPAREKYVMFIIGLFAYNPMFSRIFLKCSCLSKNYYKLPSFS